MIKDGGITVTYLKNLLYEEVKSLTEKENICYDLVVKKDVLNNLLNMLNNYSIEDIYNNRLHIYMMLETGLENGEIYSGHFLSILTKINDDSESLLNLKSFCNMLQDKLIKTSAKLELYDDVDNLDNIKIYRSIISKLKYKQPICKKDLMTIEDFLSKKNVDKMEIIKLCEYIKVYNERLTKNYNKNPNKYAFLDMLNYGYEVFPNISLSIDKNNKIDSYVNNLFDLLKDFLDDYQSFKPQLPVYDPNVYDEKEYKKIYYDLMNKIQIEIYDTISLVKEEDFYFDEEVKRDILNDYHQLSDIYLDVRNYFEDQLSKVEQLKETLNSISENGSVQIKTKIYFASNSDNDITHIEKDFKSIPNEYYNKVINLLRGKMYGTLMPPDDKQFVNHTSFAQFRELRDDQVRIIYMNMDNNSINVLGAGVKKNDKDKILYTRLTQRNQYIPGKTDEEKEEYATEAMSRIEDYCKQNYRKGNR